MTRSILLLFAHPALYRSRVNAPLLEAARGVDGVRVCDLYASYPDFQIDVEEQQRLLLEHELIVFQHPFFWYSSPSLLKEWQDLVLTFGFAYGRAGTRLHGKYVMSAITTGGVEDAYGPDGQNRFTMTELLRPFEQTAHLCGMGYLPPFLVHGTHRLEDAQIGDHASDFESTLTRLADPRIDLASIERERMNGFGSQLTDEVGR